MKFQFFKNHHLYIPAIGCLLLIGLEFPLWYGGMNFIILLWRYLGEKNTIALPPRWLTSILAAAVFILIFATYGTIFDKEASPLFFSCLCSLKILEFRQERDHLFIVLLLMFLLATKFLFSIDIWLAPIAIWLLYHLFTSLLPVRNQDKTFKRYFVKAILLSLPVTLFLYFLFPRFNSYMVKSSLTKGIAMSGFGNELRPGSISDLALSKELVFHAEILKGRYLDYRDLYWRGMTLKINEGFKWVSGGISEDIFEPATNAPLSYKITLEPHRLRWTFPLDYPTSLSAGSFAVIRNREGNFTTALPVDTRIVLKGESDPALRLKPKDEKAMLQLAPVSDDVKALVKKLSEKTKSRNEIVSNIVSYFGSNGFFYTLSPGTMDAQSVDDFLFRVKKGFCEHYASSFAILARAAGIPTRVVIGYQGGEYNELGNFYAITSQDAHAWNEYVDDDGYWKRVDVVDVVAPLRTRIGAEEFLNIPEDMRSFNIKTSLSEKSFISAAINFVGLYLSSLNFYWTQWLLDFNFDRQAELLQHLPIPFIILLFIFTAGTFIVFLIHRLWTFWTEQRNLVSIIYKNLLGWAQNNGLPKEPFEGPINFLSRLETVWPHHKDDFEYIIHKYVDFTYSERNLTYEEIYMMANKLQKIEKNWKRHRYPRGNSLQ